MSVFSIIGWLLVIGVCIYIFIKHPWICIGIIVFLVAIRFAADIFWYGRDDGQW